MEHVVLVPASVYNNKCLNTQTVRKKELPKYQAEQYRTYQIDSLKMEINKKLFAKADSLVDKILSCPRIKRLNWQILILDGVQIRTSLSDFAQQLRCKNTDVPDIYSTLVDAAGIPSTLVLNQNTQTKERNLGPLQDINFRSCKSGTHTMVLLMGL